MQLFELGVLFSCLTIKVIVVKLGKAHIPEIRCYLRSQILIPSSFVCITNDLPTNEPANELHGTGCLLRICYVVRYLKYRRSVVMFTWPLHFSLSWAWRSHSTSFHPISFIFILILPSSLRVDLQSGLFISDFPTTSLYELVIRSSHMPCPFHPPRLDHTKILIRI
jgi:hypothetical protein